MDTSRITIKTTRHALRMLRLVAAYTGEKQYEVLERLLEHELGKLHLEIPPVALPNDHAYREESVYGHE